eukprot:4695621-Pyramimonas_sp.AAC.1
MLVQSSGAWPAAALTIRGCGRGALEARGAEGSGGGVGSASSRRSSRICAGGAGSSMGPRSRGGRW